VRELSHLADSDELIRAEPISCIWSGNFCGPRGFTFRRAISQRNEIVIDGCPKMGRHDNGPGISAWAVAMRKEIRLA
jgi:hypothetical protein